ncbi:MAG: hypothetical protein ACREME_12945 [Gemmatimonadales bacterium]
MRFSSYAAALLLVLPGAAVAQDRAPFPDHWLTLDAFSQLLALTSEQRTAVSAPLAEFNAVLQRATQRREELKVEFQGTRRFSEMTVDERQALTTRLEAVRDEYESRQAELDRWLGAIRGQLTAAQQARLDAMAKPRLVPETPPAGAGTP